MSVNITLYPETLFGYYLQLIALELGGWSGPLTSQITFKNKDEYVDLVKRAIESVIRIRLGSCVDFKKQIKKELCESLETPKLYGEDYKTLKKVGLDHKTLKMVKLKKVKPSIHWCIATLDYVERVINNGGPLQYQGSPLMLFRATVFGALRGVDLKEVKELAKNTTIDSIGLGLIGGLASFMGSFKLEKNEYEYFLIPDGSPESIDYVSTVLEVFHGATLGLESLVYKIKKLVATKESSESSKKVARKSESKGPTKLEGLSLDLATYFSTLIHVLRAVDTSMKLRGLIDAMAFEKFMLVRVDATGNRPQVMWTSPLAISQTVSEVKTKKAEIVLNSLYDLASEALDIIPELTPESASRLVSYISKCINHTILYLWSRQLDFLKECTRELGALSDYTLEHVNVRKLRATVHKVLSSIGRLAD
ncbi:MAG: hypothetical protein QXY55_06180 [Candidatus Korarchaeota archaeon]